jgi:predicted transcriptional regulator
MATGKIEKLGLVKRIEELVSQGTASSEAISVALKAEGFNVSQPTVSRYLKKTRDSRREATQDILNNHIQEHVPADLTALEAMEAQCLTWAHENNDAFAHRLAGRHIAESLNLWLGIILNINPASYADPAELNKARLLAVREIMTQCIGWISDDFAVQKARLAAMRQASGIIEMKLRFAGVIGGEQSGNVFILGNDDRDRLEKDAESGKLRLVFKKEGKAGNGA